MHSRDSAGHRLACLNFIKVHMLNRLTMNNRELVVRALALSPLPAIESVRLAALGESVVGPNRHPYDIYVSALAQLRAGNHAEAVVRFQQALK